MADSIPDYIQKIKPEILEMFKKYKKNLGLSEDYKTTYEYKEFLINYYIEYLKKYRYRYQELFEKHRIDSDLDGLKIILATYLEEYEKDLMSNNVTALTGDLSNMHLTGGYKKTSNSKINSKKVSKKSVVSQNKRSIYKEILGKKMKIYKMPDSRKEYVKYKGELHHISDYKGLMKQKAKPKAKSNK